ncbi:hydroxyacid dehydrogenase [Variovorax sp. PBL-E5]|uniref:hydroxyacid dehydrogenase n=1 Tax=Variovorax sp. PBL-E5 TaxID=434014 RepID=UPI001316A026|nr:hydroxyacid dehydrogenase [Variovorax sp. PBL-E5]VTU45694.1 Glycerate dehydrogenase [Variovorax sp. PBL-E5]
MDPSTQRRKDIDTRRKTVALIGEIYHSTALDLLREHVDVVVLDNPSSSEIAEAFMNAQGAIVRYPFPVNDLVLAQASRLVVVASSGRGTDSIDIDACTRHGVAVVNNPGLGTLPVSEHAMGAMLALARRLFECARAVREPQAWPRRTQLDIMDLHGRTLGIVGLGLIGSEMARKCRAAFDMNVIAYDPHVSPQLAEHLGVTLLPDLHELLRRSDVVSLHCELNAQSRGMIGEAELRQMQARAFLVNTSRGKVVQQAALVRALQEGWIAGAALDVYEDEPLSSTTPLFALPNLLLSPHIAGLSGDALYQLAHSAVRQVLDALSARRPAHLVNPNVWDEARTRLEPIH